MHRNIKGSRYNNHQHTPTTKNSLNNHLKTVRRNTKNVKYNECQYTAKIQHQLNNHVQTVHNKIRPYNSERQTAKLKKNVSWYKFRAATLNILSAKDDIYIEQAALAMCRHSITVLVIQEARRTTEDWTVEVFLENKKYTFRLITSGNPINNTHGVGFLIRQDKEILIKEIKAES